MKILVTGGSGTFGGYVLRELLNFGYQVTCYSRTPPIDLDIPFVSADILDAEAVQRACAGQEVVLHLAAVPGPKRATPQQTVAVNVIGTLNVLQGALKSHARRVVFASSAAALGFTFQKATMIPRYFPIDEEHPCEPQDEYGLSKLLAELACKSYSEAHGIQTICLRINNSWYLDWEGALSRWDGPVACLFKSSGRAATSERFLNPKGTGPSQAHRLLVTICGL